MPAADTHAAIEWPTLMTVCRIASAHFDRPLDILTGQTRIDELTLNEIDVIGYVVEVEAKLTCDIPDYELTTTATLAQIATLAEKFKVKA